MGAKPKTAGEPTKEPTLHTQFREDFNFYFTRRTGVPAPWSAKEAGCLTRWMKENPTITRDQWRVILQHRNRSSNVNHALNLSSWIGKALTWLNFETEGDRPVRGGKYAVQRSIDTSGVTDSARHRPTDRAEGNAAAVAIALSQAEADCTTGDHGDISERAGVNGLAGSLFGSVIEGKL